MKLSNAIYSFEYLNLYDGGSQLLIHKVRQQFWVIDGHNSAKKVSRNYTEFLTKSWTHNPLMSNLRVSRV